MSSVNPAGIQFLLETKPDKSKCINSIVSPKEETNIVLFHIQKLGQIPNNSSILILNKHDLPQKPPEHQLGMLQTLQSISQTELMNSALQDKANQQLSKLQIEAVPSSQVSIQKQCSKNLAHNEKSGTDEKMYVCDMEGCGRTFHNLGYIKYHKAVHLGEKDLKCTYKGCGRMFIWPAHFKYHLLTHTGERLYKCTFEACESSFYTLQRLAVHMRTHTGERPFVCSETGCKKAFTTAGNLKNHIRLHTGARPFLCPVEGCGRRFTEHSSLRKHNLVHTGEKPHVCDICGKSFSQSGSRNQHRKHHHLSSTKKVENYKESGSQTETIDEEKSSDRLLIFQQGEDEEMLHMQDFSNETESVVFSNVISSDHVITENSHDQENMDCIVGTEEILGCEETVVTDSLITHSNANVVVLAQPQDMVSITTNYQHATPHAQEEIVYKNSLITSHHEETSIIQAHITSSEDNSIIRNGNSDKSNDSLFNHINLNNKNERVEN